MQDTISNLSIQVIPVNTTEAYPIIDAAIGVIQSSGLRYKIQAFATIVEGRFDELVDLIQRVREAVYQAGGDEIILNIQMHTKRSGDIHFEDKTSKYD